MGCESITGWQTDQPRARSRSDADRQDTALVPRHVHRILGLHPPPLCGNHRCPHPRLHGQPLLVQHAGGRCEACEGQGMQRIEMSFLPDVQVLCDVCGGSASIPRPCRILFKGKSIGEALALSVDDAAGILRGTAQRAAPRRACLADVGLGYLSLGSAQPDAVGRREPENQAGHRACESAHRRARTSISRAARASTPCTCSTNPPSDCTWRTSRSW